MSYNHPRAACANSLIPRRLLVGNMSSSAMPLFPPRPQSPFQRRIVAHLDDLQAETAAELEAMLPAVLDRAFRGEL